MLMFGDRESAPPGHVCAQCRAPATYVRRNTLVGGGHRRSVYWCAEHDDPRTHATVNDRGGPFPWSCTALECPCTTLEVIVSVTPEIDAALDAWGRCLLNGQGDAVALRLAANESIAKAIAARGTTDDIVEVGDVWAHAGIRNIRLDIVAVDVMGGWADCRFANSGHEKRLLLRHLRRSYRLVRRGPLLD